MKVTITKVEQRPSIFVPAGTPMYVYEISFETEKGLKGIIEMPHSEYTPEAALQKIKDEVVTKAEMIGKTYSL